MSGGAKDRRKRRRQEDRQQGRTLFLAEQIRWSPVLEDGFREVMKRMGRDILAAAHIPDEMLRGGNDSADSFTWAMLNEMVNRRRPPVPERREFIITSPDGPRPSFYTSTIYGAMKPLYRARHVGIDWADDPTTSPGNAPALSTPTADPGLAPTLSRAPSQEMDTP